MSQLKSFVQYAAKDEEGARKTQQNFIKQCPLVSQVTSAVQALKNDKEGARATQLEFLKAMNGVVDGMPVIGHTIGMHNLFWNFFLIHFKNFYLL